MIHYKRNRFYFLLFILSLIVQTGFAQEVVFFSEGTNNDFYDQGIVNVNDLGESTFEHTYPPGGSPTKWNDKVPCSATAFKGNTSLKFNYTSANNGNWVVHIHRNDWSIADISDMDSISFYIYSETALSNKALPLIGVFTESGTSDLDTLANYNTSIPASAWTKINYPLDSLKGNFNLTTVKAVVLAQSEKDNSSRIVLIDELTAYKSLDEIPPVNELNVTGYDSHVELNWEHPIADIAYRIYASFNAGQTFELRSETAENYYLDFVPEEGKNSTVTYRVVSVFQENESQPVQKSVELRDFSDDELLNMVQEYAFRYFWEGAHQTSGMALERSNGNGRTAASGATGMGLMAMIVAHEREYRPKEEIKDRILKVLDFLETCDRHHGAWSHWYNADTKKTQPFSQKDDGGDIVETSFVAQALIALKHYFSESDSKSVQIREKADQLWKEIDWDWYRKFGENVLYWHWSPNYNFEKNMKVSGWNECQITYVMAASSPTYGVPEEVYHQGWARNGNMVNSNRSYYGYEINLARNWGGPLFWIHYSHLGINPHGLQDQYADYWQEHVNTAKIHYQYAIDNPLGYTNYGEKCWGLTASDDPDGYAAHKPMDNDNGTVSPTAALASMPYTPEESMKALNYFYRERGQELFGIYGPYDAFNDTRDWVQKAWIGIDQGPIVVMIENYRTGLLWNNVMRDEDVQSGLQKLGFDFTTSSQQIHKSQGIKVYPNPAKEVVCLDLRELSGSHLVSVKVFSIDGKLKLVKNFDNVEVETTINCTGWPNGLYYVQVLAGDEFSNTKLLIQK